MVRQIGLKWPYPFSTKSWLKNHCFKPRGYTPFSFMLQNKKGIPACLTGGVSSSMCFIRVFNYHRIIKQKSLFRQFILQARKFHY